MTPLTMASKSYFLIIFPFLLFPLAEGIDIKKILSQFPDFSSLNNYLSQTNLAAEINSRQTITVLAVDNAAISAVSGQPADVLKKVLALHVVLDYYDTDKFHQLSNKSAILATLFQATGLATGQNGFLNATDMGDGQVAIGSAVPGAGLTAKLVKVLVTHPYNISVVQISSVIVPPGITGGGSNHSSNTPPPSPTPSAAPNTAPAKSPSSGVVAISPSLSPSPPAAKSPPPTAASTPTQAPAPDSPAPSDNSSLGAPTPDSPAPSDNSSVGAPVPDSPAPSDDSSVGAPAPDSGSPMMSPPSPPMPPAESPIVADVPAPAAQGDDGHSSAARAVVGAGLAALVGAAFLGAL